MRRREPPPPPAGGPMTRRRKLAESKPPAEDTISNLPDAVLGEIISLLPTKDGARTQILASRWRHLWRSAPLNLDCRGLKHGDELAGALSRIISSHQGPCRRLCIHADLLDAPSTTVDSLLRSDALGNLQELEFSCFEQPPPASIFRFSLTLRVVTIGCCNLPDSTVQGIHFPLLKQLGLEFVCISECSLHSLIAGCPTLESLLIHRSFGFLCIRINSLSLRSVGLDSYAVSRNNKVPLQLHELIIDNAPCLERLLLLHQETGLDISVIEAPKLETIGFLSDGYYECSQDQLYRLAFGSTVILGLHVDNLAMVVRTVKIVAVRMRNLCLDAVIGLLACFPCLEKLYIKARTSESSNAWRRKHRNLINCLDIRLKTIVLKSYRGIKSQVNFVSFFVLNARMLESMTLQVETSYYNDEFLVEQRRKLQLQDRVSRGAQFHFTTDRCIRTSWDIKHVRDLDVVDPFVRRC
ncbi:F-box/FBD/LRR-repeat protein At3g26920-like [Hordeum vulgare subsp. vulgare]|uniref:Predicted protein n=1 Tax=Hordeum vulgare subsp. vulgare TaxID=112509 RepID=F2EH90_HORVV|nr:F-box/FBD/LRR-repeat protein At3g26920-like [Hordeum vulgare subsp. vulgare]KAI4987159.1 hypothetical protein ZWY2020_019959 [Hordeum vulgare]BAK06712.1 predicted protein [Hordeum vulgare subsp. vulgare]